MKKSSFKLIKKPTKTAVEETNCKETKFQNTVYMRKSDDDSGTYIAIRKEFVSMRHHAQHEY